MHNASTRITHLRNAACCVFAALVLSTVPCSASLYVSWYAGNYDYDIPRFDLYDILVVSEPVSPAGPILLDFSPELSVYNSFGVLAPIEFTIEEAPVVSARPPQNQHLNSSIGFGAVMAMANAPIIATDWPSSTPSSDTRHPMLPVYDPRWQYHPPLIHARPESDAPLSLYGNTGAGFEVVPEPTTLMLFGCGAVTFLLKKRRQTMVHKEAL